MGWTHLLVTSNSQSEILNSRVVLFIRVRSKYNDTKFKMKFKEKCILTHTKRKKCFVVALISKYALRYRHILGFIVY